MRRTPNLTFSLMSLVAMSAASLAAEQPDQPLAELRRNVPRDAETKVYGHANWNQKVPGVCTLWFIPTLLLVAPPQHGNIRFLNAKLPPPKGSGCTNPVDGVAVMYRPNPGFVGADQFTYRRTEDPMTLNKIGVSGTITVLVTVN